MAGLAELLPSVVQADHVVLVVEAAEGREKADVDQRLCNPDEESYRNESRLVVEDMTVESAFAVHRSQDQQCDPAAAGDDVCRCQDGHTGLQLVEERMELLACLLGQHRLDHHCELRMLMLQVPQSAPLAALPR